MKNLLFGSLTLIVIGMGAAAHAADMPVKAPIEPAPAIPGWTFSLTPYAWAAAWSF